MPKFFVSTDDIRDGYIRILEGDAYHIARALRMAVGDYINVADGGGKEYSCRLCRIRDDECLCEILDERESCAEPPRKITLYMAYPKGDKMETVTQKAVELGASRIVPFESERCIKRPSPDKLEKIRARLTKIAHEAAKQCGRAMLPEVERILSLNETLEECSRHSLTLFCYEDERNTSIKDVLSQCGEDIGDVGVVIGCEGGFSPTEAERFIATGAKCVTLGPRILRCETAPEYALSALSYHFEL